MRDDLHFFFPLLQFRGLVEIVVTVITIAVVAVEPALKPMFIVAAMQSDVSHARRDMLGRPERTPQQGLIDVAEADVVAHEFGDRLRIIPTLAPPFDPSRILDEMPQQLLQVFAVQTSILERDRELDEQRAQLAFRGQRVQTFSGKLFVPVIRPDAGRRSWFHHRQWRMCERPMQFRGEEKIWIDRPCLPRPQTPQFRPYVSIKRSVDFDDVEESREKFDRMYFLPRHFRRIQNAVPVFIRPAGSPNADSRSMFHTGGSVVEGSDARRLAHRSCGRPMWRGRPRPRPLTRCGADTLVHVARPIWSMR